MKERLREYARIVDGRLEALLSPDGVPKVLSDAMNYSVFSGGKRLRPALNIMGNALKAGDTAETLDIACAIEMIHAYSLIHDDLPCMDNDALRRGKATNHVVFGEAYAVLAGDALLNLAYETMLKNALMYRYNASNQLKAMRIVADAAGPAGMIAGQCCDIEYEGGHMDGEELEYVHRRKTGALITASLLSGLMLSSPGNDEISAVIAYGDRVGLAFQIIDDILDETGTQEETGKAVQKDGRAEKLTYPKLYGIEGSYGMARDLTEEAAQAVDVFGKAAQELRELAFFLLKRRY